jgi:type III pantothenate kinase
MGTATTVSVIDQNGAFRGGAIMAGVGTSLDSLVSRASLLPNIRVEAPKKVIGTNTADCMRSGAVFGAAAMLDGMCDRIEAELKQPATVVVTGGLGAEIAACSRRTVTYDGHLLLNGLRILYERNT